MKRYGWALVGIGGLAAAALTAGHAFAHHSAAMFDATKSVTVAGVVKTFQWTNPHSWIHVTAPDGKGGQVDWSIEMTSPNLLSRAGWRPGTIKPGDKITVVGAPLRDGNPGAQFRSAVLGDGRRLSNNGVLPPASPGAAP